MITPARARWQIRLTRSMTADEYNRMRVLPGLRAQRRPPTIVAPLDAAWLAEEFARRLGILRAVIPPSVWDDRKARAEAAVEAVRNDPLVAPHIREWDYLKVYQDRGFRRATAMGSCYFYWPPGSGKTLPAILWGRASVVDRPKSLPAHKDGVLVVAPAGARDDTWPRQIGEYTALRPFALIPESRKRASSWSLEDYLEWCAENEQQPWVITAWESLHQAVHDKGLARRFPFRSLLMDELHRGKAHQRVKRYPKPTGGYQIKRLHNVASAAEELAGVAVRALGLSGTPIPDRIRDCWAQWDLLNPGSQGRYWGWVERYADARPGRFGMDTTGVSNQAELRRRGLLIFDKVDEAEVTKHLPPLRVEVVYVPPHRQKRASGGTAAMVNAAAKRGRGELHEARLMRAASLVRGWCVDFCQPYFEGKAKGKGIIFSGRHKDMDLMASAVDKAYPGVQVWVAAGETSGEERRKIREAFMAHPGPCLLIGGLKAWMESYDLQDADFLLEPMLPWTPRELKQSMRRVYRLGMTRSVRVVFPIAEGTIAEYVADRVLKKLLHAGGLLDDQGLLDLGESLKGIDGDNAEELLDALYEGLDLEEA